MLILHMFALCYGGGFQTMGTFPSLGEYKCMNETATGEAGLFPWGKVKYTGFIKILSFRIINDIFSHIKI